MKIYVVGEPGEDSGSCSRALHALRSVRQHITQKGQREQRTNFAPYSIKKAKASKGKENKRLRGCSLKMICLSSPQDDRVPTTAAQKEVLMEAGLGAKNVLIPDMSCSREEFWDIITSNYPKLLRCGGFELLRCMANSRALELISRNISQSPKLLKAVIGNGRVYVRPLQKDLDLEPIESNSSSCVSYSCKCI